MLFPGPLLSTLHGIALKNMLYKFPDYYFFYHGVNRNLSDLNLGNYRT